MKNETDIGYVKFTYGVGRLRNGKRKCLDEKNRKLSQKKSELMWQREEWYAEGFEKVHWKLEDDNFLCDVSQTECLNREIGIFL